MKSLSLALLAALAVASSSGCTHGFLAAKKGNVADVCSTCGAGGALGAGGKCDACNQGGYGVVGHHREYKHSRKFMGPQGPPSAAITYPYYTTRGPRDFLADNPPSIGP